MDPDRRGSEKVSDPIPDPNVSESKVALKKLNFHVLNGTLFYLTSLLTLNWLKTELKANESKKSVPTSKYWKN